MRVFLFSLSCSVLLLNGCAQRLDDVDDKITDLQRRMSAIEVRPGSVAATNADKEILEGQKMADLRSQLMTFRNELTVLAGKIEALEYDSKRLNTRVESMGQDYDQKLRELVKGKAQAAAVEKPADQPAPPASSGALIPGAAPAAKETKSSDSDYDKALKAHQEGDFATAEKLFLDFAKKNPKNSLADNAIFWVGDGYLAQKQYKKAIAKFQDLIDRYPKSDKRCEAMSNQIVAFKELGMDKEAKVFTQVKEAECK